MNIKKKWVAEVWCSHCKPTQDDHGCYGGKRVVLGEFRTRKAAADAIEAHRFRGESDDCRKLSSVTRDRSHPMGELIKRRRARRDRPTDPPPGDGGGGPGGGGGRK